jgi:Effector-associated domain 10
MISHDDLKVIFERIVKHQETESDRQTLRSLLRAGNGDNEIKIGKNIVNISEGRDILRNPGTAFSILKTPTETKPMTKIERFPRYVCRSAIPRGNR